MTPNAPRTVTPMGRAFGVTCPHCGLAAMSVPRKLVTGWGNAHLCAACGQKVEGNGLHIMAWTAPFIFACIALSVWAGLGGALAIGPVLWGLGALALIGVGGYLFGAPLRRVGRTDAQRSEAARRRSGGRA